MMLIINQYLMLRTLRQSKHKVMICNKCSAKLCISSWGILPNCPHNVLVKSVVRDTYWHIGEFSHWYFGNSPKTGVSDWFPCCLKKLRIAPRIWWSPGDLEDKHCRWKPWWSPSLKGWTFEVTGWITSGSWLGSKSGLLCVWKNLCGCQHLTAQIDLFCCSHFLCIIYRKCRKPCGHVGRVSISKSILNPLIWDAVMSF